MKNSSCATTTSSGFAWPRIARSTASMSRSRGTPARAAFRQRYYRMARSTPRIQKSAAGKARAPLGGNAAQAPRADVRRTRDKPGDSRKAPGGVRNALFERSAFLAVPAVLARRVAIHGARLRAAVRSHTGTPLSGPPPARAPMSLIAYFYGECSRLLEAARHWCADHIRRDGLLHRHRHRGDRAVLRRAWGSAADRSEWAAPLALRSRRVLERARLRGRLGAWVRRGGVHRQSGHCDRRSRHESSGARDRCRAADEAVRRISTTPVRVSRRDPQCHAVQQHRA